MREFWEKKIDSAMLWDIGVGIVAGIVMSDIYHHFAYGV